MTLFEHSLFSIRPGKEEDRANRWCSESLSTTLTPHHSSQSTPQLSEREQNGKHKSHGQEYGYL